MTTTKTTPSEPTGTKRIELEELEGRCMQLWVLKDEETNKWNGGSCDCPILQGNFLCKRMIYYAEV